MICPRCDSETVRKMVDSPVPGAWEVHVCETCYYSWRSTETPDIHGKFKLDPAAIPGLQIIPPVPPLDK